MSENYDRFFTLAEDILRHPAFQRQKAYRHHKASLFEHSILVAYSAHRVARRLKLDEKSVVRGALLHDFFLYDWHVEGRRVRKPLFKKHGFTHARRAMENADFYFDLNPREKDIILKHMFPLNWRPPRYLESWIVNFVDSIVTIKEYFRRSKKEHNPLLQHLHERLKKESRTRE